MPNHSNKKKGAKKTMRERFGGGMLGKALNKRESRAQKALKAARGARRGS